jgi:glycosyltransferase involved in cell wall biosynthesis
MAPAKPPLRIANVMLGRHAGGLEQAALDYHQALHRAGHEVHTIIHPRAAIRPRLENRSGIWHGLPHLGEWDMLASVRLRRLLNRFDSQVSIAHGNRAMGLLQRAGAEPLIAVLPNYKMGCCGATAVFYPTLDLRGYAVSRGVGEHRLYHIPSMVDVPAEPPSQRRNEPPVIGTMGRFVGKKVFDVFLRELGYLRRSGVKFRDVLAGEGPDRRTEEHTYELKSPG